MSQRIYHALLTMPTRLVKCEVIFWHEKYWLVPSWRENMLNNTMRPLKLILLDNLPHQRMMDNAEYQFFLNETVPEYVVTGDIPEGSKYRVIDFPDIEYDVPEPLN